MLGFYRHLTEMADLISTEIANAKLTRMEAKLYNAAFEGSVNAFWLGIDHIELLLTANKNTVLHMHFTAETGNLSEDFVKYIINLCPSIVLQANAKRETPLHIAARYGHSDAVEILMEHSRSIHEEDFAESVVAADKKLTRATNIVGDSALHEAARYNHVQVVKLLIKEDPDCLWFPNNDGESPLYIAAVRGRKHIVSEILKNYKSPAYGGPDGRTALHAAVIRDDEGTIHMLASLFVIQSFSRDFGC